MSKLKPSNLVLKIGVESELQQKQKRKLEVSLWEDRCHKFLSAQEKL